MPYNTLGFNEFVDNVERTVLEQIKNMKPNMVRSLFSSVPWQPGDGEKVTFNSVALSGFAPRVTENENYPVVNPTKGNELSKTQLQYGDKLEITRRMLKFNNRYIQAKFGAEQLVQRLTNSLDLELTMQAFAEADQTTFTPLAQGSSYNIATSDAQALASSAHVYGGITFSNILSGGPALSSGNLTTALTQMSMNTPDDFGTYIAPSPDTIVIDANEYTMVQKCAQLFGSKLVPESANNAVSWFGGEGSMKVIGLKFGNRTPAGAVDSSSNVYRWAVLDSNMCRQSWQLMMAEEPTPEQQFTDQDNVLAKILVTMFAAYAIVQPQGSLFSLSTTKPTLS